ncbi:MAG: TetR/AcrR family transcriptional regulator [Anaerosomatales bacterium]|nr:TetR/AcrR family transcriptional regulator [Anaerosomatales bacterium]
MSARPANPHLASEIISATAAIVEERGPEGVTMREVARRIGYSPTSIYLHFANKDELLDQTVNRAYEWFADEIESRQTGTSAVERIRQGAHAYLAWGLANPGMYRLMFEWGYLGDISPDAIFARRRSWRRNRQIVELGIEQGVFDRSLDSAVATDVMWVAMHGLTSLAISGRMYGNPNMVAADEVDRRAHALADALADGWLADWTATSPL